MNARYLRTPLAAILVVASGPALADACGDLIDRVVAQAGAQVGNRSSDFANFTVDAETSLTLSCGGLHPSSLGAQHRGETPPATYYAVFARAGQAVTGVPADLLEGAVKRARADATRLRHSSVPVPGALVTCSLMKPDRGAMTLCAVIEQGDRS